jgi:glycosyltransferase involved in cell wall biosynthesis
MISATKASPLAVHHTARPTTALRIALVDPSFFTVPYDAKLAGALGDLGHCVTVYGEARRPGEEPTEFKRLRLLYPELLYFGTERWTRSALRLAKGALHWRAMRRLVDDLRRAPPDIIHFQWSPLPAVDRVFLRTLRRLAPVVLTAHDSHPFNGTPSRLMHLGAISILSEFDGVIVHTEEACGRLASYGVPVDRLVRIPHGPYSEVCPVAPYKLKSTEPVRFLLFGKLKHYKGADLLIEAFRRLPLDLQARVEVQIVGKPYMDVTPLRKAAAGLEAGVRLDFRFVSDGEMNDLLTQTDVVVFPYREIDVSGVLMAALSHGRPIIASQIGGFAELLVDRQHALLVPPDDAAALATAMAQLCAQPQVRLAMGAAVAELGRTIPGWEEIARRTTEFYYSLLRPVKTSAPVRK